MSVWAVGLCMTAKKMTALVANVQSACRYRNFGNKCTVKIMLITQVELVTEILMLV